MFSFGTECFPFSPLWLSSSRYLAYSNSFDCFSDREELTYRKPLCESVHSGVEVRSSAAKFCARPLLLGFLSLPSLPEWVPASPHECCLGPAWFFSFILSILPTPSLLSRGQHVSCVSDSLISASSVRPLPFCSPILPVLTTASLPIAASAKGSQQDFQEKRSYNTAY